MPELPEVETIARGLRPHLVGRRILGARVRWSRTIAVPSAAVFRRRIRGQTIEEVSRRGKFLHLKLSEDHLFIHLRMSGDLQIRQAGARPLKHDRLILSLGPTSPNARSDTAQLAFNDTRKFGRVWLTGAVENVTRALGPEPLEHGFTAGALHERLRSRRRQLKPLLLDQTFLAGLGNIYTDEALHMARLHPLRSSQTISASQAERLLASVRTVLKEGIRRNGASIDWVYRGGGFQNHFRVYDRTGEPCPVCGTRIRRLVVGQRGTHICPRCQRL
jgi:formamidopyrimidine-DNA glycosylase